VFVPFCERVVRSILNNHLASGAIVFPLWKGEIEKQNPFIIGTYVIHRKPYQRKMFKIYQCELD